MNWKENDFSLPVKITDYYFSLIDKSNPEDPLRLQVFPTEYENCISSGEQIDPLSEVCNSPTDRLIHRYSNRAAFLTTDFCMQYCRYCFRRRFTGNMNGPASREEIEISADYIRKHEEIKELLLTGGDVLTLSNSQIREMVECFRKANPLLIIRICTRAPVVEPDRIDDELISIFKSYNTAPFFLMVQYNHYRELTFESIRAVNKFVSSGIMAFNQTVLLRNINDDVNVLEKLCNSLLLNRIKPYYVFQGDLVSGTSFFRVPLRKTLEIEKELRKKLSGLAMPTFAIDLPNGGGKVPLSDSYITETDGRKWIFKTLNGNGRVYYDPDFIF